MNRDDVTWRGYWPACPTPFHRDGSYDPESHRALLELYLEMGVHGVLINGTTGEWFSQTADERRAVVGERHHARPRAHDPDAGQRRDDPDRDRGVPGRAVPAVREARRRRLGPGGPAPADDERVVRRLLQGQPSADVLHHRLDQAGASLRHVDVEAVRTVGVSEAD